MSTSSAVKNGSDVSRQYLCLHLADSIGPVLPGRLIKDVGPVSANAGARSVFAARDDAAVEREFEKVVAVGVRSRVAPSVPHGRSIHRAPGRQE